MDPGSVKKWRPGVSGVTRADAVVVVVCLLLAGLTWPRGTTGGPAAVEIEIDGGAPERFDLVAGTTPRRMQLAGPRGVSEIEIEGDRVRVVDSPCAQRLCQRVGWLTAPGDLAVCVPNRLVVRIVGARQDGLDAVTH